MTRPLTSSPSGTVRVATPRWSDAACATPLGLKAFSMSGPAAEVIARTICSGCPIRRACLQWGVLYEDEGIWGGLTRDELRRERHRHGIVRQEPFAEGVTARVATPRVQDGAEGRAA